MKCVEQISFVGHEKLVNRHNYPKTVSFLNKTNSSHQ